MLLVLWSDPTQVPELVPDQAKCEYWGKRWAGSKQRASLPRESAVRVASFYLQGLIQQPPRPVLPAVHQGRRP
jgi:hypothetical protein